MATTVKRIPFSGMVRATTAHNNAEGNCEEIINLRQTAGTWRPVGRKRAVIRDVDYEQVFVHKHQEAENYIGVRGGEVVWFASLDGDEVEEYSQVICSATGKVGLAAVRNILLIRDENSIAKALFTNNAYQISTFELPDVPVIQTYAEPKPYKERPYTKLDYICSDVAGVESAKEVVKGLMNQQKSFDPEYTEGYVFLCTTYQMFDGSETKPTPPVMVKLGDYVKDIIEINSPAWDFADDNQVTANISVCDMLLHKLEVRAVSPVPEQYRNLITKINIYATPAISHYDFTTVNITVPKDGEMNIDVREDKLTGRKIGKLLFYRVNQVDALNPEDKFHTIRFDAAFTANETLPVDSSGWMNTVGDMFVYNNRLHLYNVGQHISGIGSLSPFLSHPEGNVTLAAICYLTSNQSETPVRCDIRAREISPGRYALPSFLAFPDSRCKKIEIRHPLYSSTPYVLKMETSDTYNFSFFYGTAEFSLGVDATRPAAIPADGTITDNMKIIASEASNPHYFPPAQSYMMPGEVYGMAVNTEQISASQVGMYPLYVFTSEGIYGLQSGDGSVLYGSTAPISAEVALEGSHILQTRYGIVFVTQRGLKLISGQQVTDLSLPLQGKPDTKVRGCAGFRIALGWKKIIDVGDALCQVPFTTYIRGAVLGYDITEDELTVSNAAYKYSYVYSFSTTSWHKITETFSSFSRHIGIRARQPCRSAVAEARLLFSGSLAKGDRMVINIDGQRIEHTCPNNSEVFVELLPQLVKQIRGFRATVEGYSITIQAKEPGEAGNSTPFSVEYYGKTVLLSDGFTGGRDAGFDGTTDICDIREEEECVQPTFIQTRPLTLDSYGFKKMSRCILRGEIRPDMSMGNRFGYGCCVFATNNLASWELVADGFYARDAVDIALPRAAHPHRYFTVAAFGYTSPGHVIAMAEIEGEEMWDNKLR